MINEKKPNTRVIDYVTLVQDNVLAIDGVPADIREDVTKWIRYFSGIQETKVEVGEKHD
ncbi:hypothetical protein [Lactobacillus xujianguonis]|uniref:hypothetical protein n=1 Tax=Lactobacillus xujianguonis TaxID=2495899 RepID=UPI00143D9FCE|nr:hypothetical protein [Lactobacillus xujianguonis]